MKRPWLLASIIGLLLTLISAAYVAHPDARPYDPGRPQLYSPGPEIRVTKSTRQTANEVTHPDICAPVITDNHRGFPMSMLNRFGPDSCTQNRYLHPIAIVFNVMLYTFIARGAIALWQKYVRGFTRLLLTPLPKLLQQVVDTEPVETL
jgi:hypothetical protein